MHLKGKGFMLCFCYAQGEKALYTALEAHLEPLKQQGLITTWHNGEIRAGAEWQREICLHLQTAHVILLLISPSFLVSDFLFQKSMLEAIARHERNEALVIPILMRPVDWEATPISKLRPLPSNRIPVSKWRNRDEALLNIAQGIREAVNTLLIDKTLSKQPEEVLASENPSVLANGDNLPVSTDQSIQSVFFFNTPFIDINEFYGRRSASSTLLSRTAKRASTSIVGPRRIGKTWLMEYLRHILPAQFGFRIPFAYVDTTSPRCVTVDGFVSLALEEWGYSKLHSWPGTLTMIHLEHTVKEMKRQSIIPLLCIDEFEGLTYHEDAFDLQFFANLRSIAANGLVLVLASKRPPIEIISQEFQSSPFFNILEQVTLKAFNEKEAETFIQTKSDQAGFTSQEREYFKYYGKIDGQEGWPPVRLQLVGTLLLEAKQSANQAGSAPYQPNDPFYWHTFARRLEEMYEKVVR